MHLVFAACVCLAQIRPEQVAILENAELPASLKTVKMYQRLRGVPDSNVLFLDMGRGRSISRALYDEKIARPVAEWLKKRPGITTLLATTGVPYLVDGVNDKPESAAAFDSEIATVLLPRAVDPTRWAENPLFVKGANGRRERNPRTLGMVFTCRLDGPSLDLLERMVSDAIAVEKVGLSGGAFADSRGFKEPTGYGMGDALIREGLDRLAGAGFAATLDEEDKSWQAGASGRSAIAEGAAYYAGWYDLRSFQDVFGEKGLARGAIAWHLASSEAVDIWSPGEKGWAVNLLLRGAAATWGPVEEPYVHAFPHTDVLIDKLLEGASLAEAYWLSVPHVSWAMVLLGDPLYRPFAIARPSLVAEPYRDASPGGLIPPNGRKSPLLTRVRCVGPPGSSLPAFKGTVRASTGVRAAGGDVRVPALHAGESCAIEIPDVEIAAALGDPFRLVLELADESGTRRDVILEGRAGLARLSACGTNAEVLAVDSRGDLVLTGGRAVPALVRTSNLESLPLSVPSGASVMGAEVSPDAKWIAINLRDDAANRTRTEIRDARGSIGPTVPEGKAFMKWLAPSEALFTSTDDPLSGRGKTVRFDVETGQITPLEIPDGWRGQPATTSGMLRLEGPQGQLAFQRGGEKPVEVLRGKGPFFTSAFADDLAAFWGLDAHRKLWLAFTPEEEPRAIGEAPGGVVCWGPISRRAAWADAGGKGRLHDTASGKTFELDSFVHGWWSADESRLLYLSGDGPSRRLRLWTAEGSRDVVSLGSIGVIAAAAMTGDGKRAVLLAGADVELDAWAISLEE